MLLPFHYKVYESAPLATFVNIFLKIIGAALLVAGIPLLFEADGPIAIVLVAVGVCFLILGNVLGNVLARRKVKKLYGKDGSKLKKLIPMKETVTEENGVKTTKTVPDIVEGMLNPLAKITICRDKGHYAMAVKIEYFVNQKPVGKLRMRETVTIQTMQAVNTVSAVLGSGDLGKQLEFVVRPGEEVIIHYSAYTFMDIERH